MIFSSKLMLSVEASNISYPILIVLNALMSSGLAACILLQAVYQI